MRKKQTNKQTKSTNQTTVVWAKICPERSSIIWSTKKHSIAENIYIHHILTEQINRRMYN